MSVPCCRWIVSFLSSSDSCVCLKGECYAVTAFVKNGTEPIIGLFGDQVDKNLTSFTTKLVDAYLPLRWNMTGCGKTCGSDHMSWHKAGYRSAFVTEGMFKGKFPFSALLRSFSCHIPIC